MKIKFLSSISILVIILLASSVFTSSNTVSALTTNNPSAKSSSKKIFETDGYSGRLEINVGLVSNTTFTPPHGISITSKVGNNMVAKMTLDQLNQNSTFASISQIKIPVLILFKNNDISKHKILVESEGGQIKKSVSGINWIAVNLSPHAIEKLRTDPNISSIEPDVIVKALDHSSDVQIKADQVWTTGDIGQGVPVAILDSGVNSTHPEISERISLCHSEITNDTTCNDDYGHGTHVAGILGAVGVNIAAKGVAPSVTFDIDKVLDVNGSGTISGLVAAIDWARINNAKVISMSLGTGPLNANDSNCDDAFPALTSAVNNATVHGITVVAAAGNDMPTLGIDAPACISSAIAVTSVDNTDTIAPDSSHGVPVQDHGISAPGVNIFSSVPPSSPISFKCSLCDPSGYRTLSGTSMATPHVAGTIALMLNANPTLTPPAIKSALYSTACTSSTTPSCPSITSVPNTIYGHGRINAAAAFAKVALPGSPTGLAVNLVANTVVKLSWTAPVDNGPPISGYKIEREPLVGPGFTVLVANTSSTSTTYSDSTISAGHEYDYRVSAINSEGIGFSSNIAAERILTSLLPESMQISATETIPAMQKSFSDSLPMTAILSLNANRTVSLSEKLSITANTGCFIPAVGDWTVASSCTLGSNANVQGNVLVQPGAVLTIPSGLKLTIDFVHHHILVKNGGGILVKAGGTIN